MLMWGVKPTTQKHNISHNVAGWHACYTAFRLRVLANFLTQALPT